jgi:magnesium-transporting ATPase (P-type)
MSLPIKIRQALESALAHRSLDLVIESQREITEEPPTAQGVDFWSDGKSMSSSHSFFFFKNSFSTILSSSTFSSKLPRQARHLQQAHLQHLSLASTAILH